MKKKKLESLKKMSKDQLIDDLIKNSIKGGCCSEGPNGEMIINTGDGFTTKIYVNGGLGLDTGPE